MLQVCPKSARGPAHHSPSGTPVPRNRGAAIVHRPLQRTKSRGPFIGNLQHQPRNDTSFLFTTHGPKLTTLIEREPRNAVSQEGSQKHLETSTNDNYMMEIKSQGSPGESYGRKEGKSYWS